MSSKQLIGIQGLRGVAAWLVVVDHGLLSLIEKAGADPALAPWAVHLGGFGVKLFFMISGLVMIFSSTHAFGANASRTFLRRRLMRVVPLYWLTSAIYLIKLLLMGSALAGADVARSFLFIPYLNAAGELQPLYGLGWTLNYELFFYALFATGLLVSPYATLLGTAAVIGAGVWAGASMTLDAGSSWGQQALYFWSRPIMLFFVMGMFTAVALLRWGGHRWFFRWPAGWAFGVAAVLGAAILYLGFVTPLPLGAEMALMVLPVAAVSVAALGPDGGALARCAKALGDASYSIYLTHAFVVGPLARLYARAGLVSPWVFVALSLVLATLVGGLTYRWIERPVLRWLHARWGRPAPASRSDVQLA